MTLLAFKKFEQLKTFCGSKQQKQVERKTSKKIFNRIKRLSNKLKINANFVKNY